MAVLHGRPARCGRTGRGASLPRRLRRRRLGGAGRAADADAVAVLLDQGQADALDLGQLLGAAERAVLVAVGDDGGGLGRADTVEYAVEGGGVGGVDVHLFLGLDAGGQEDRQQQGGQDGCKRFHDGFLLGIVPRLSRPDQSPAGCARPVSPDCRRPARKPALARVGRFLPRRTGDRAGGRPAEGSRIKGRFPQDLPWTPPRPTDSSPTPGTGTSSRSWSNTSASPTSRRCSTRGGSRTATWTRRRSSWPTGPGPSPSRACASTWSSWKAAPR